MGEKVRRPVVAGTFYPVEREELERVVKAYLSQAKIPSLEGKVVGGVVPHAGYVFSGQAAAYVYKALEREDFKVAVIMGPSHHLYFSGASVYPEGSYETPLGKVKVCERITSRLLSSSLINYLPSAHLQEHSIEVQIPFLQVIKEGREWEIVPLVLGNLEKENLISLADTLLEATKGEELIFLASSDLSHYPDYKTAREVDRKTLEYILSLDPEGLLKFSSQVPQRYRGVSCALCGENAVATLLYLCSKLGVRKARLLTYYNSGDVERRMQNRVVGYGAVVFLKEGDKGEKEGLSEEDKQFLLRLARESIQAKLEGKALPEIKIESTSLKEKRGVFVTLKKEGNLRGCIGYIHPLSPLAEAVSRMAIASAFEDPRFPPLKEEELPYIKIEISVLSPLREIKSIQEFEVGKHGILLQKGPYSAVFLPQVAPEQGWDRETTLKYLSLKAGLPPDGWKEGATFYVFTAEVFEEKDR